MKRLFISVGLFEKLAFRAVINDAIIYKFREKKYTFPLSQGWSWFLKEASL